MKYASFVFIIAYLILGALFSWFVATRVGLFELPDGFFYFALGDFLLYNRLFPIAPFNVETPQTLYGPVYSLLLAFLINQPFPWGATGIPFIQLSLTIASGAFVFVCSMILIGRRWAYLSLVMFLTLPFLFIYATVLMAESVTLFLATLWITCFILLLKTYTSLPPSLLIIIGSLLALTKNAFLPIFFISAIAWIFFLWKKRHGVTLVRGFLEQLPVLLGVVFVALWMRFNVIHHNTYALTNYTGRHLYNNVVHQGKIIPNKTSDIYKTFLSYVENENNLYRIEYEVQRFFIQPFAEKKLTEAEIDRLFLRFSVEAIRNQPIRYATHVFRVAWGNLTTPPYHETIIDRLFECRIHWHPSLCSPQYPNKFFLLIWKHLLTIQTTLYPVWMTIIVILGIIGTIGALLKKNRGILAISAICYFFLLIQSAAQQIEGRYVIPLFGMLAILATSGAHEISREIMKRIPRS